MLPLAPLAVAGFASSVRIGRVGSDQPAPPSHEAYAALRTALTGSGVLTMVEAEQWARRISADVGS